MKNVFVIIFSFTLLFGCKQDDDPDLCGSTSGSPCISIVIYDSIHNVFGKDSLSQIKFSHSFSQDSLISNPLDTNIRLCLGYSNEESIYPHEGYDTILIFKGGITEKLTLKFHGELDNSCFANYVFDNVSLTGNDSIYYKVEKGEISFHIYE